MDNKNITYQCSHCNRKYKRKGCYDKHIYYCRLLNNDNYNSNSEFSDESEERYDIPSKREMWHIILHQSSELKKLKREIDKLKQRDYYHKKKISVIDYLNNNFKPKINYEDWVKNINITQDDLNFIFDYGSIKGTSLLFKNFLCKDSEVKIIPIISTNHTLSNLYIYSNNSWKIMIEEQLKDLLELINKKLFNQFQNWGIECEKNMTKEKYKELYILNLQKLISGKHSNQQLNSRIKNSLSNILRITLDSSNIL